jgi:CheY-like chemotaxis protein
MSAFKIMLIDDQSLMRSYLRNAITKIFSQYNLSFEIIEGNDGADLVKAIDDSNYKGIALIFTDEKMPKMNGSTAIEYARNMEKHMGIKEVPIVSVTSEDEETMELIKESGASHVIQKPASRQQLRDILSLYTNLN